MTDKNSKKNIPQLRFPEFTGEWVIHPLFFFLHEHKTKSDGKCDVHSVSVTKGVVNQVEYLGRSYASSDTSKYNLAKPNDIIYTKSPTGSFPYGIVKMNKNPYNVIVSPLYGVYSPTNKYIGYIIDSYFESPERTNSYLGTLVQKGAKNTIQITNDTFISKNVCFPSNEVEQQKIAECLSSLDDEIAGEQDMLDALKLHKRGLMQQLFPQNGQTTPTKRFPGFEGEWEVKTLGEVCIRITDGSHNPPKPSPNGGFRMISSMNIHDNAINFIDYRELSESDFLVENKRTNVSEGDVLVTIVGTVGRASVVKSSDLPLTLQRSVAVLKHGNAIIPPFLLYIINNLESHLQQMAQGGAQKGIYLTQLSDIIITLPSLPEQQKIAGCLYSLDDEIKAQQDKVEALKLHKRGLMQKLFPKID